MQKFSNFQGANFEIVPQYVTFRYIALFPNPYPLENTARRRGPPLARKKCGTKFSTTQNQGGAVSLCFGGKFGTCSHTLRALRTRKTAHLSGAAVLLGQPN